MMTTMMCTDATGDETENEDGSGCCIVVVIIRRKCMKKIFDSSSKLTDATVTDRIVTNRNGPHVIASNRIVSHRIYAIGTDRTE